MLGQAAVQRLLSFSNAEAIGLLTILHCINHFAEFASQGSGLGVNQLLYEEEHIFSSFLDKRPLRAAT